MDYENGQNLRKSLSANVLQIFAFAVHIVSHNVDMQSGQRISIKFDSTAECRDGRGRMHRLPRCTMSDKSQFVSLSFTFRSHCEGQVQMNSENFPQSIQIPGEKLEILPPKK